MYFSHIFIFSAQKHVRNTRCQENPILSSSQRKENSHLCKLLSKSVFSIYLLIHSYHAEPPAIQIVTMFKQMSSWHQNLRLSGLQTYLAVEKLFCDTKKGSQSFIVEQIEKKKNLEFPTRTVDLHWDSEKWWRVCSWLAELHSSIQKYVIVCNRFFDVKSLWNLR